MVPYTTHGDLLHMISSDLSMFDEICVDVHYCLSINVSFINRIWLSSLLDTEFCLDDISL